MRTVVAISILTALAVVSTGCPRAPSPESLEPPEQAPRLILLLVVDQLGAKHLERFDEVFEGGLRRLLDEGVVFREAHHAHSDTSTAPGHATIATGAHPSRHGIISNYWIDRASGETVYAVEDERYERAPTRLESAALGDWLKRRYQDSRVFALSAKDRSAILLGGRQADGAYWYDWKGTFTSSEYYPEANPSWLEERNAEGFLATKFGQVWTPMPFEAEALARMGVTEFDLGPLEEDFPHTIGGLSVGPGEYFFDEVFDSPWMDQYILRLARAVIEAEQLGQDRFPDLLALGFSTSDGVGHSHGPDSREFFDILVRLDRELGSFLEWLDETVGLDKVTIALSSDHGSVPVPEIGRDRGLPSKRAGAAEIECFQSVDRTLDRELGEADWFRPGPFFQPISIDGVSASRVRERTRAVLEGCPSVSKVWLAEDLTDEASDDGDPNRARFARSYFAERSPDFEVEWQEYVLTSGRNASSHGTPHHYDTHVPLILRRPGLEAGTSDAPVRTVDIAPTLAQWAGVEPGAPIDGRSLEELLESARASAPDSSR